MLRENDLRECLHRIDHKGYPAYKDTKGQYQFGGYILSIDHVQGDPFAAPSKVSVIVNGKQAGFDESLYDTAWKRVALQDVILRKLAAKVHAYSFKAKGSGKSGLISVSNPGQEILDRSACTIDAESGKVTVRIEIGFPANGRTINARELEKILYEFLPACVKQTLYANAYAPKELKNASDLAEDQHYIREQLKEQGLVAFVANGAILPRKSGVSMLPMKDAVAFQSPDSMEVTMNVPHAGVIKGMGIRKGVTLIVGGGYHGKSTLLKALELGVYDHIAGDGREYVITDDSAMKLRAEDGRSIQNVDISMFIRNLPNGRDTVSFYTEDASGSTSQAANTVEAIEMGSSVFLIDEDTSATNFMIRDELMQRVVQRDVEPIIPFIDRVRELYESYGISTILVAGSCGSYFHKADTILQMNRYEPMEITAFAKKEAENFPMPIEQVELSKRPGMERVVKADMVFQKDNRIKMKTMGRDGISINKETVDLRYVEQLVDTEQLNALAYILKYMKLHVFMGKTTLQEGVEQLYRQMQQKGFTTFCGSNIPGNLVLPRKQEMYAMLNRCRNLIKM
ncbi:MAG: ABC-ATPase domain-containing protein [Lachnospiraceae bacterium]|nr:ABC-ATPase domain-containing protein [Lachnospiraceae bacterium]HCJ08969.1 isopentenyl-diphosphate delta-isomerase [Lachnospiraceae bacterium]